MGAFAGFKSGDWSAEVAFATDVSDEHDGSLVYFNGGYRIPLNEPFDLKLGAHVTWADDDYMDTYFGVNSGNVGNSGLPMYEADSGLKAAGNLGYTRMLNDAKDSPLVDDAGDDAQIVGVLAVTYTF